MTQQAESSGWDVATKLEHSHGGVPCVATAEIRRLQAENEALRTALAQQGKPVAYLAWRDGKPCYAGDDAVCEDAVWPLDADDDRESMPVYTVALPDIIPVRPNIKNQIFTDISSPQPLIESDWNMNIITIKEQGAPIINCASVLYESDEIIVIELDMRSKYCYVGASSGNGVYIEANERSLHLHGTDRDAATWVEVPGNKTQFLGSTGGRYTINLIFGTDDVYTQPRKKVQEFEFVEATS